MVRKNIFSRTILLLMALIAGILLPQSVQGQNKSRIYGTVYELDGKKSVPLDYATVTLPDYGIGTTASRGGNYSLAYVPQGKVKIRVQYVGKHAIDTLVNVKGDMHLDFTLTNEDFRLEEVQVTAQHNAAGKSTSSNISRQAMEHMQATSLYDIMALLPGGFTSEQNLSDAKNITLRQSGNRNSATNSLGAAIIRDGAPISNNANLSILNTAFVSEDNKGKIGGIAGTASPTMGVDLRTISTENIEDVEVIRGIPSVEYGDLTSGAVIIHSKAGREPLRIKAKANPKVYQGSIGTGFELGENKGALNLSADYAYNVSDPMQSFIHYQRLTGKALYSKSLFANKLRSNTSFDIFYGKHQRDKNPIDEISMINQKGEDLGFTLNTNGLWNIQKGWLENIRYVLSGSYTSKNSYYEEAESSGNAPYSGTTTDGTTLTNIAGEQIPGVTNFSAEDSKYFAYYIPNSYIEHYNVDSKELNFFAKLTANFFKQFSKKVNNRILIGADFKADGNEGKGKTFEQKAVPYRPVSYINGTFRPRSYKDIPWIKQFGVFAEENFNWTIGRNVLSLQAGVRYDNASVVGGTFSPRFNASLDIIPDVLTIHGGYGITAKMPTLLFLYPEPAYFEYTNLNELANESIAEADRRFITTTRVFDTQNKDLKIAKNHKAEIGFDLRLGKVDLSVTGFTEHQKNGYSMTATLESFQPVVYKKFMRDDNFNIVLDQAYNVISRFNVPTNNRFANTKGVEFELNIGRIEAIRTSFQLNGAWMRTKSYTTGMTFYENNSESPASRHDIGIYEGHASDYYAQHFTTALRATHNIPQIGFVVTLTAQAVWQDMDWAVFHNDTIPIGSLSQATAQPTYFNANQYKTVQDVRDAGLTYLLNYPSHSNAIKESYNPYFLFNLNLTKEISDMLRVSFFANNMFRSYPRRESKRTPGEYEVMFRESGNKFYFGVELSLKL